MENLYGKVEVRKCFNRNEAPSVPVWKIWTRFFKSVRLWKYRASKKQQSLKSNIEPALSRKLHVRILQICFVNTP